MAEGRLSFEQRKFIEFVYISFWDTLRWFWGGVPGYQKGSIYATYETDVIDPCILIKYVYKTGF